MSALARAADLEAYVARLPVPALRRLAEEVERARQSGRPATDHERIFRALRPRLRREAVMIPRAPAPLRLVAGAFEDLLTAEAAPPAARGRIRRATLARAGAWIAQDLIPETWSHAGEAIALAASTGALRARDSAVRELQRRAGEAMLSALAAAGPGEERAIAARLGGPAALQEVRDMARLLRMGREIAALHEVIPRPLARLGHDHVTLVRAVYDGIEARDPEMAVLVPFLVMGRLAHPWTALRLPAQLSGLSAAAAQATPGFAMLARTLLSDLERRVAALAPGALLSAPPDEVARLLSEALAMARGLAGEFLDDVSRPWLARVAALERRIGARVLLAAARAEELVLRAMPPQRAGAFGRGRLWPADLESPLDGSACTRASAALTVLGTLAAAAETLGCKTAFAEALDRIRAGLARSVAALSAERRALAEPRDSHRRNQARLAAAFAGLLDQTMPSARKAAISAAE